LLRLLGKGKTGYLSGRKINARGTNGEVMITRGKSKKEDLRLVSEGRKGRGLQPRRGSGSAEGRALWKVGQHRSLLGVLGLSFIFLASRGEKKRG